MPRRFASGRTLLEASKCSVKAVQRHLHGIEREVMRQHLEMDLRIFVPSEADEPYFAVLLRLR